MRQLEDINGPESELLSGVCVFGQGIKVEALQCGLVRERMYNKIHLRVQVSVVLAFLHSLWCY